MATHLTEGTKAPVFTGVDQDGNKISLKDYTGKKVVLYFYPKDNTPGCTAQACNLRDNFSLLTMQGIVVIGVSADDAASHKKFRDKFQLPFPLIADMKKEILEKYGAWGEKNLYGKKFMGILRTTFVIDEAGKIIKIFGKPNTKNHAEEILKSINNQ
jgi:thioredoxin-dependent peroxiredoxin